MPPSYLDWKKGRHKSARLRADPWAHNLKYQRELGFMHGNGGPVAAAVVQTRSAPLSSPLLGVLCTPRRVRPSPGTVPLNIPAYVPPGAEQGFGFDEAVAWLCNH